MSGAQVDGHLVQGLGRGSLGEFEIAEMTVCSLQVYYSTGPGVSSAGGLLHKITGDTNLFKI